MAGNPRARPNNKGTVGNKGGRPPGASTNLTRYELAQIPQGKRPVDVMLRNMWWWDEQADAFAAQLSASMEEIKFITDDIEKVEAVEKAKKKFDAFIHARDKAQACAVDAAPYCHAKLQSITLKPSAAEVIEVETQVASTGNRNEEVEYRKNYDSTNVTPIIRRVS